MDEFAERLGKIDAKIDAAHKRMDDVQINVRDDLKDLKESFKSLSGEIKELNAYMNRGKGWSAAMLLLSGSAGAGIIKLLAVFAK